MNPRARTRSSLFLLLLMSFLTLSTSAQTNDTAQKNSLPIDSILSGPDHADLPWKVSFSEPKLMYQQQYFLLIRARVPAEIVDTGQEHHILHFMAKVQDKDGNWLPGNEYNKFEPAAKLGDTKDIECGLVVYFRPGEYNVALILFDSATKKSNVVRRKILVRGPSSDPLPELTGHIPPVEFPDDFPDNDLDRVAKSDGESFIIGRQLSPLAVSNHDKVRIDIVLDVSKPESRHDESVRTSFDRDFGGFDHRGRRSERQNSSANAGRDAYGAYALGRVLQSASILSRLAPTDGCIYLAAVDPIRMQVPIPSKASTEIDWPKLQKDIQKLDQNMIDARVLQNHKGPGNFLRDLFEKLSAPSANCGGDSAVQHYIVVVSPSLTLPEFNNEMRISDASAERARFFYFHVPGENPYGDDLGKLLKSSSLKKFDYSSPESFRKALATYVSDLRSGK